MHLACKQIFPTLARLIQVANGDQRLFAREDRVEAAWRLLEPIVHLAATPVVHEPGTRGPAEADALIADGGRWHEPDAGPLQHSMHDHFKGR